MAKYYKQMNFKTGIALGLKDTVDENGVFFNEYADELTEKSLALIKQVRFFSLFSLLR